MILGRKTSEGGRTAVSFLFGFQYKPSCLVRTVPLHHRPQKTGDHQSKCLHHFALPESCSFWIASGISQGPPPRAASSGCGILEFGTAPCLPGPLLPGCSTKPILSSHTFSQRCALRTSSFILLFKSSAFSRSMTFRISGIRTTRPNNWNRTLEPRSEVVCVFLN